MSKERVAIIQGALLNIISGLEKKCKFVLDYVNVNKFLSFQSYICSASTERVDFEVSRKPCIVISSSTECFKRNISGSPYFLEIKRVFIFL